MRRWLFVLFVAGCTTQSPCETAGGSCMGTNEACPAKTTFSGFDPQCEPKSKCCRPVEGFDAGSKADGGM
ncbi:MAG: hypothetical protein JNK82_05055 [Myxococcaceae bacterium]|nr:hypothetical protein [Myxococcaceae bacterium]